MFLWKLPTKVTTVNYLTKQKPTTIVQKETDYF